MYQLVDEVQRGKRIPSPPMARAIRVAADVSQARMARELGVHRMTVQRWEAGETRPRGAVREAYADLLQQLRDVVDPDLKAAS